MLKHYLTIYLPLSQRQSMSLSYYWLVNILVFTYTQYLYTDLKNKLLQILDLCYNHVNYAYFPPNPPFLFKQICLPYTVIWNLSRL